MSQALYLKYRPQLFSELDEVEVREFFEGLIKSGKLPHAFLFTGPKGTGKTSTARIIAKGVNCLKSQATSLKPQDTNHKSQGELHEPCNECDACASITNGSAMDVIEIDAASNRGIDDVRELREKVKLTPVSLKYKVFIIDECHMLTTEASNALLKTLEEPPSHTLFVLCTTEAHKVLPTIESRCTKVMFRKATSAEIKEKLQRIVKAEGIKISDKSLEMISNAAGGSFRDGDKILEQISLAGDKVEDDDVAKFLSQQESADPTKFIECLLKKDTDGALAEISKMNESGGSFRVITERAIEILREDLYQRVNSGQDTTETIRLIRAFDQAGMELKEALIPQLPFELLAVEWGEITPQEPGKTNEREGKDDKPKDKDKSGLSQKSEIKVVELKSEHGKAAEEKSQERAVVQTADKINLKKISLDEVKLRWSEVLKAIRPVNHSVEAFLKSTQPLEVDGNKFVLEVFYKFHKERLESDKPRRLIEDTMENVYGAKLKLICKLGEKAQKAAGLKGAENISGKDVDEEIIKAAEEIFGVEAN